MRGFAYFCADIKTPDIGGIASRSNGLRSTLCYQDRLIVTHHVEDVEPFKSPCRIDAVTVLVCRGGEVDCSVNLRHYHIDPNTILACFPSDIIQLHQANNLEAYAVLISPAFLQKLQIDFKQRSDFYLDIRQNAAARIPYAEIAPLKPYYTLLKDHIETRYTETPEIIRGLIRAFSYTIIGLTRRYTGWEREAEDREGDSAHARKLFTKFMALIQTHHARERGIKFYADKLCLTTNHLSRATRGYTGKTATEWVNEYVILEARIWLRHSDLSIQEVAYKLNFPSQSAFGNHRSLFQHSTTTNMDIASPHRTRLGIQYIACAVSGFRVKPRYDVGGGGSP